MSTVARPRGAMLLVPVIIVFFSFLPATARAVENVTLDRAIAAALEHNGELQALREEQALREAGKVRALLLPNPTLELEAETGAMTGSGSDSRFSVGMSQEILLGGKRGKRAAVADHDLEIFRWQLAERERRLKEEVAAAFYDALRAGQRVELAGGTVDRNRQLLHVAGERLSAGDIPELEANLIRVELARSEGMKIEAENALQQSRAKLLVLMGVEGDRVPAVEGRFDPLPEVPSLAELVRRARENRPDLRWLEAEERRGDADLALARAEGIPDLTVGLAVSRETGSMEIGGVEGKDTAHTVGLKLSLPLPLFDRNSAGIREAGSRHSSAKIRLVAASRAAEREVAAAHAGYQNSLKLLSLYLERVAPQLEENLTLTREAYRLGEVGVLAVIEEQKKFADVSGALLDARHDCRMALVRLEAAAATGLSGGVK